MFTMNETEMKLHEIKMKMDQLRIELRHAEDWNDRANDTMHAIREMIMDLEESEAAI